jgi:hypothetical protein
MGATVPFSLEPTSRSIIEEHFTRKKLKWEEDYFLRMLSSDKRHDVYFAVIALRDCGTERSIAPLKSLLHHPMQDVKATSILLDPAYPLKDYAMWALEDSADERAVDAVLQYFKANRSKLKSGKINREALGRGIRYLRRCCAVRPDSSEFLDTLATTWDLDAVARLWEV